MSKYFFLVLVGAMIATSFPSCKTYLIPVESFKEQFDGMDSSRFVEVAVRGPLGEIYRYKTFPLEHVSCLDSKRRALTLEKTPSLEIRITDSRNRRTIFYFDRIYVTHEEVSGVQSRFVNAIRSHVLLNSIKKIEIQDGKKNFRYVDIGGHSWR